MDALKQSALVICINYHNDEETGCFIQEVLSQPWDGQLHVVVVANSPVQPLSVLNTMYRNNPRVTLACPDRNLGYFGGAAFGLKVFLDSQHYPDWVIVSNTDVSFDGLPFFQTLSTLYPNGFNGVLGPSILSLGSGMEQNPFLRQRLTSARMRLYKVTYKNSFLFWAYNLLSRYKRAIAKLLVRAFDEHKQIPEFVYAVHGAFQVFHRSYFEAGGSFKYSGFLYGEEILVGELVRKLGLFVIYDPRLRILHREHSTTSAFAQRTRMGFMFEGISVLIKEFY